MGAQNVEVKERSEVKGFAFVIEYRKCMAKPARRLSVSAMSEKARFAAERGAEQQVRQAEAKVTASTQRLAEMRRANGHQLKELKASCEKKLRDTAGCQTLLWQVAPSSCKQTTSSGRV